MGDGVSTEPGLAAPAGAGTTAELLGRPARTFSDWAQAHADAFAS